MNPLIVLSALFATAMAAPSGQYAAPIAHGAAYAASPIAHGAAYAAAPIAHALPAPIVQVSQGPATTHINKPAPVITKQLHHGQTTYLANVHEHIIKPATPHFPIQVPTVLKGTTRVNPTIRKTQIQTHVVNEPYPIEKRVPAPYDVPVYENRIIEVPTPVHVQKPYAVPVPTPVRGETIIQQVQGPAVIRHHHTNVQAPIVHQQYAAASPIAYAGYGHAGYGHAGYGQAGYAAPIAHAGYANAGYANAGYAAPALAHTGYATAGYAAPVAQY